MQSFNMYGPMTNQPQQAGPQAYQPWQNRSGFKNMSDNAYASGVNAQAQKDIAAFGAYGNLGIAGQNAMGQYGQSQQNALANTQIAQANALGQLGAGYYNTLGQLGQYNAAMAAAASQAGADTNKAAAANNALGGLVNAGMYGAQMGPYTAGNMPNFNFGGFGGGGFRPGFDARGPEGRIASGSMRPMMADDSEFTPGYGAALRGDGSHFANVQDADGDGVSDYYQTGPGRPAQERYRDPRPLGGRPSHGRNFNPPPAPPYVSGGNMQTYNPYDPFKQAQASQKEILGALRDPRGMPNMVRQDMGSSFAETQKNIMDPGIMNSLNGQMAMGYGALSNLYGQSNYGFNTGRSPFGPRYSSPKNTGGFSY